MREHVQRVCEAICSHYFVTVAEIIDKRRLRSTAEARSVCMFVVRTQFGLSHHELATEFDRDYSTVIHACKKVNGLLSKGEAFTAQAVQLGVEAVDAILAERRIIVKATDRTYLDRVSNA